jgi:hypothetical protein
LPKLYNWQILSLLVFLFGPLEAGVLFDFVFETPLLEKAAQVENAYNT